MKYLQLIVIILTAPLLIAWGLLLRSTGEYDILNERWRRIIGTAVIAFIVLLILIKLIW